MGAEEWGEGPGARDRKGGPVGPIEGWEASGCSGQADPIESSSLWIEGNLGTGSIS
jgi:hypothetical protein